MKTSENGLAFIMESEGCVLQIYDDPAGYPTIGVGHLITAEDPDFSEGITELEAMGILAQDVRRFEMAVNEYVEVWLTQNQFDVLIDFAFNVGVRAFRNSTLLKVLNRGEYNEVPKQLKKWIKAKGRVLQGLVERRDKECEIWVS